MRNFWLRLKLAFAFVFTKRGIFIVVKGKDGRPTVMTRNMTVNDAALVCDFLSKKSIEAFDNKDADRALEVVKKLIKKGDKWR